MSEDENAGVEEIHGAPEPETSNDSQNESSASQGSEQSQRNDAEKNWAEMRRAMREKDRQIDELKHQFEQFANRRPNKEEQDELSQMAEDDLLTVSQAKKLVKKMALDETQKVLKDREANQVEDRLRLRYRDYDDVINKENIELFLEQEKELAETLRYISDPYQQAEAAYKMLKKFGRSPQSLMDKKKAEQNSKKPVSVQAAPKSGGIGDAHKFENGFNRDVAKQLYKEMQDAIKYG